MFLDEYSNIQPVAYKTLIQAIKNNKISHAYIFETNNNTDSFEFVKAFVKDIFCIDLKEEDKFKISLQVDNNEYPELKLVIPSGINIKKEEILELQNDFKNKSLFNNKKIYIINNAEKLNQSSSNTLLKFLEEPSENIIAILIVASRYELLKTILSRCQLISLVNNKIKMDTDIEEFLLSKNTIDTDSINVAELIEYTIKFICFFEKNKNNTLLFINREFNSYFNNREKVLLAFEIMKLFYLDVLKFKQIKKIELFKKYEQEIENISNFKEIDYILKRIEIIIECYDRIKYNVNLNLLMDYYCNN